MGLAGMADDLKPRREEDDSEEYESLFESFQSREERPQKKKKKAESTEKGGLLGFFRSLTGRRKASEQRRESAEQAMDADSEEDTARAPVFTGLDGEMDIETARESLLVGLEEEEEEEQKQKSSPARERKSRQGLAKRLGLKRGQALVLGLLMVMVLLVYVAFGIIVVRSRSQWAASLATVEPTVIATLPEEAGAGSAAPSPSPSPTSDEESEGATKPTVTPTITPTPTPQPSVATRFDLQVMRNPTDLDLRVERGLEYLRLGAPEEAVLDFEYVVNQDFEYAEAHLGLGRAYYLLRRWGEAEEELGTAISLNEDLEDAHFWLGKLFYLQGAYEESAQEFDWAAEINPENPRNETWLARAAVENVDLTEAQGAVERALSLDDRYPLAYVARAEAEVLAENYESAQGDLLYAKDLAPYNFEVLNALARLYAEHFPERVGEAEQLAQQALNWATWSMDEARALHTLGRVRLVQGRREDALEVLAQASDQATVDGAVALPELVEDFDRALAP